MLFCGASVSLHKYPTAQSLIDGVGRHYSGVKTNESLENEAIQVTSWFNDRYRHRMLKDESEEGNEEMATADPHSRGQA